MGQPVVNQVNPKLQAAIDAVRSGRAVNAGSTQSPARSVPTEKKTQQHEHELHHVGLPASIWDDLEFEKKNHPSDLCKPETSCR